MVFRELVQYCKLKAIADLLSPTEESIWRDACRAYSETFHTPLTEVYSLDPEFVLLNNFEKQLEDIDVNENIENILEQVYKIENPNYEKEKEDELQDFIKRVEENEKKRALKKIQAIEEVSIPADAPKAGSVDFSNMKDEES